MERRVREGGGRLGEEESGRVVLFGWRARERGAVSLFPRERRRRAADSTNRSVPPRAAGAGVEGEGWRGAPRGDGASLQVGIRGWCVPPSTRRPYAK